MTGSSVMVVRNIILYNNSVHVAVQRYAVTEDSFSYPVKSSFLGIYKVSRILDNLELYPVCEVLCKYVAIPYRNIHVVVPLLHTCVKQ